MKIGLVFSGGGARGSYQVGVWKALNELNIKCDIVVGTSIGAINSAMYCQGDYKSLANMWNKIDFSFVFGNSKTSKRANHKKKDSIFAQKKFFGLKPEGLRKNIEKCLDLDKIYNSDIKYGLVVTKFPSLKMVEVCKDEIKKENFIDYLIASATVFPFFKSQKINNKKYVDGGLHNPLPIDYAKKLGADKIIAVNISAIGKNIKVKEDDNTIYIKPYSNIGRPLNFSKENAQKIFKYGYNDTMKKFNKLDGKKFTFNNLKKHFTKSKEIPTLDKLIEIIDYLGTILKVDDSKIYNYKNFNNQLVINLSNIELTNKKQKNVIKYLNDIKKNKVNNSKNIDYLAALYLNNFCNVK